jgi:hypothetical protein
VILLESNQKQEKSYTMKDKKWKSRTDTKTEKQRLELFALYP